MQRFLSLCVTINKMLTKLVKVSSELVSENKWWCYYVDEYTFPDGSTGEYHFVRTTGSTMVIPRIRENVFIMTKQYRYLNQKPSIEFPGGGIKFGLEPLQNAKEELEEEAGYRTENLIEIGSFNPFNGVTDEICHVFLANDLVNCLAKPEPSEEFEIFEINHEEIINFIKRGEIWDGMTLAAWSVYQSLKH